MKTFSRLEVHLVHAFVLVVPRFQERCRTVLWNFSVEHLMRRTISGIRYTVAVRLYASQVQLIASAHNDGILGISNPGNNCDAWILAASAADSMIASPRVATPLYSGLSAVLSSCFIFLSKLSEFSLVELTTVI